MAFFVESRSQSSGNNREPARLDLELIAIGKRTGLTFSEMNEFRVRDLLAYARAYTGKDNDKPKMADQKDIDSFYSK